MQIDSWTVSPDEGRIGRLQRCSSVTTLTSEKLPDEDNDDEKHTMTDLSKVLREEAAHCRRLAELATEHTIRQDLMEMAARLQAIADEIDEP